MFDENDAFLKCQLLESPRALAGDCQRLLRDLAALRFADARSFSLRNDIAALWAMMPWHFR